MLINLNQMLCHLFIVILLPLNYSIRAQAEDKSASRPFRQALSTSIIDLHPLRSRDPGIRSVKQLIFEGLLKFDHQTGLFEPALAESYQWLDKGARLRFFLRKNVAFHSGQSFSAKDVEASFETLTKGLNESRTSKDYYNNIKKLVVVNSHCVDFFLKRPDHKSFSVIVSPGYSPIFSRHQLVKKNGESEKVAHLLNGTGPYQFEFFERDRFLRLKKNDQWWGRSSPNGKKSYQFESTEFHFIADYRLQLEMLKKRQLDYIPSLNWREGLGLNKSSDYNMVRVQNKAPKPYTFIGWNLKNSLFAGSKTRMALSLAFPREAVITKIFQGAFVQVKGPWFNESGLSKRESLVNHDLSRAKKMLSEAGWQIDSRRQLLFKLNEQGQKVFFEFELLFATEDPEAYLTLFQAELKKLGVKMQLNRLEASELNRRALSQNFQAVHLAWAANSADWEPRAVWHSQNIRAGGLNFVSYRNSKVDSLIDQLDLTVEKTERNRILTKVFEIIAEDQPYLFLFQPRDHFYAYSKDIEIDEPSGAYAVDWKYWSFR